MQGVSQLINRGNSINYQWVSQSISGFIGCPSFNYFALPYSHFRGVSYTALVFTLRTVYTLYKNQVRPGIRPSHSTYYLIFLVKLWAFDENIVFGENQDFGESVVFGENMNLGDKMFF